MEMLPRETAVLFFAAASLLFGTLSVVKVFQFVRDPDPTHRIKGATRSSIFLCLSALAFFVTAEIYKPNVMCLPALLFFVGLVWMDRWAYQRIVHAQAGNEGGNPNRDALGGSPQGTG